MDNKLTEKEFTALIDVLFTDRFFADYIHIPSLGVRLTKASFNTFASDLYKSYVDNGLTGFTIFMAQIRKNPQINLAFGKAAQLVYKHLDAIGLTNETEKQKYVAGIVSDVTSGKVPQIKKET